MCTDADISKARKISREIRALLKEVGEARRIAREVRLDHATRAAAEAGHRRQSLSGAPFDGPRLSRGNRLAWVLASHFAFLLQSESVALDTFEMAPEELTGYLAAHFVKVLRQEGLIPPEPVAGGV